MGKLRDAIYGRPRRLTISEIRKEILRELATDDPEKVWSMGYEEFVQALGSAASDKKVQDFLNAGRADGAPLDDSFGFRERAIDVKALTPTQNEIDVDKSLGWPLQKNPDSFVSYVTGAGQTFTLGSPIVTYAGKYIIDGHHRWSQLYACQKDAKISAINISSKKGVDPIDMLKAVQASIAVATGKVPTQSVEGANLLKISKDGLAKWLEGANPKLWHYVRDEKVISALKKGLVNEATDIDDREIDDFYELLTSYIWSNVSTMQNTSQPVANAPKRDFMPQTDNVEWQDSLKSGNIDVVPPYAGSNEKTETNESYDLARWAKLAGLLRG